MRGQKEDDKLSSQNNETNYQNSHAYEAATVRAEAADNSFFPAAARVTPIDYYSSRSRIYQQSLLLFEEIPTTQAETLGVLESAAQRKGARSTDAWVLTNSAIGQHEELLKVESYLPITTYP